MTHLFLSYFVALPLLIFCLIIATEAHIIVKSDNTDGSPINLNQKNNYCLRNVTYYEDVAVNKTREVQIKPTGTFKIFKKSKIVLEHYIAIEKVPLMRLVNECCEGYAQTDNKSCQPICPSGCPDNGFCRAPHICQCRRGYLPVKLIQNNTYTCNPRCTSGCPFGGHCVAPELCECAEGYQASKGSCVRVCSIEQNNCDDSTTEISIDDTTDSTLTNGFDVTEVYVATSKNNETNYDDDSDEDSELFPSNDDYDINCKLQPCIGDIKCRLIGRCACADGFVLHQPASNDYIEEDPICAAVIEQSELLHDNATTGDWMFAFFIVVVAIVMMSALSLLVFKLWRYHHGSMDVEGKNEMCCKYDKSSASSESGNVDMI